jgi:hypothetical protein
MNPTIHMDTEIVTDFALQTMDKIYANQDLLSNIEIKVQQLDWKGNSRDSFLSDCHNLVENLIKRNTESYNLVLRILKERDEWMALDQFCTADYKNIRSRLIDDKAGYKIIGEEFLRHIAYINEKAKFAEWWKTLSIQQRKDELWKQYLKICEDLGIEPVRFKFGDALGNRGLYDDQGKLLLMNETDLNNSSPFELIYALSHEARHQYQHQCVQYFEITGKPPEGMSLDLIEAWKENQDHPISGQSNFGDYYSQQDEADARDFASRYAVDVILDYASSNGGGAG